MDSEADYVRSEPRTNMFVMATISATTASGAVRIRNLSPWGALIQSAALPAEGESLELKRGPLFVSGQVVWRLADKAGLRFDRLIEVIDWLPSTHSAQQAVDSAFQQLKPGASGSGTVANEASTRQHPGDPDQLRWLARGLDLLANDLADDAAVVSRHAEKLQSLDIAAQVLRKLAGAALNPANSKA